MMLYYLIIVLSNNMTSIDTIKNLLQNPNTFKSFNLIGRLPFRADYNQFKFIPTVRFNETKYNGHLFNQPIECADDIAYHASRIQNVDLKAWSLEQRLKSAMMQSSANLETAKAKHIIFTDFAYGNKTGNPVIAVLTNNSPTADTNMVIEYSMYNTA